MRHLFFETQQVELLPGGVVLLPPIRALVLHTSTASRLAPRDRGAARAVDVALVAAPADHHMAVAPRAAVETSRFVDHLRSVAEELEKPRRRRDGLRRGRRRDHLDDPRRLGTQPRASTLWAAPFCHTMALPRHPLRRQRRGADSHAAPHHHQGVPPTATPTGSRVAPDQRPLTRAWRATRADRHQAADLRRR